MAKNKTEDKPEEKTEAGTNQPQEVTEPKKSDNLPPLEPGYMHIKVYSPYQVYFNDVGRSISAVNDTGPFDILAQHHKFLTLLAPCELVIDADNGEEKIKISRGIMYVKEDKVTVFLDV